MNSVIKMLMVFGTMFALSCSNKIPDSITPPNTGDIPVTPTNLTAIIGDRSASLTWTVSSTEGIQSYRIYRADTTESNYIFLAESSQQSYVAGGLLNGVTYFFRVSSVSSSGFEGYRSQAVRAVPNLYGLTINGGAEYANSRDVSLGPVAPTGTAYMQVCNDSSFAGAVWESFAFTRAWTLTSGDQIKTVYVRFRDPIDQATTGTVSASITLDTHAAIDSVIFSPAGRAFVEGDQIHFSLFAGEPDGTAQIRIGDGLARILLYDDGTGGDIVARDGIYGADFTVQANLDFINAGVFGNFTDRAGNSAQEVRAWDDITVLSPPDPVTIYSIIAPEGVFDRLELSWNRSEASDFAQYRIYRSTGAGVDSSDFLARMINSAGVTSLSDTGLTASTTYYYRVFVIDESGLWAGSNEVHFATNQNLPPDAVVLYPIVAPPGTSDRLSLTWSASTDQDFLRYEVYRSYDSGVDSTDILILASGTETAVVDSNLAPDSTYYYRVKARDRAGQSSWSNTVSGRTGRGQAASPETVYQPEFVPIYHLPSSNGQFYGTPQSSTGSSR